MTTALGSFGDLNIAAKYLKQVNSDGYLTENIAGSFLHNAYKTHTAEEVAATYSNTTASSGGLGSLFGGAGLMAGIKSAGSGLLTVLSSIAPALLDFLVLELYSKLVKLFGIIFLLIMAQRNDIRLPLKLIRKFLS